MTEKLLVIESCIECPHHCERQCFKADRMMHHDNFPTPPDWCPLPDAGPLVTGNRIGAHDTDPTINDDGISKDDLIGGNS